MPGCASSETAKPIMAEGSTAPAIACHADGDDRFDERDQHDEPVALHEVSGSDGETRHRREERRDPVEPKGRRP